jgi:hypothetical protein
MSGAGFARIGFGASAVQTAAQHHQCNITVNS